MAVYAHIVGDSEVLLWGLSGRERLRRTLARSVVGFIEVDALQQVPEGATVLVLRGDCVFDARVIQALGLEGSALAVLDQQTGHPVAARVTSAQATEVASAMGTGLGDPGLAALPAVEPAALSSGFNKGLRSVNAPRIDRITRTNQQRLEDALFTGAYKGVTDLVTKWLWPRPAQRVTRACISLGITPNQVTWFSLVLAVAAGLAFALGAYGIGLAAGWLMTFLDTVDGKLARVTVSSSRFGDVLDHGLDLLHPPLWYWAWAMGLGGAWVLAPSLATTVVLIFATYIGGRLCEGAFQLWVARFSLFVWRPFDSFHRLVTARRNPNLILLTGGWLAGRPDIGLWLVAAWHSLSTLVLLTRLVMASRAEQRGTRVSSWLYNADPLRDRGSVAVRIFSHKPVGDTGGETSR